ncbi:monothiol glutaredoxin-S3-like [Zingiber officinale]|uniref:monothiol glutaredoxin-S3-like n=1 Tax=Zingiber officinale TaxID=94328 RepID=UPI001C4BE8D2|nr:monothiol glutaredoxin-S3-like [Zingiber officinale]
MMRQAVPCPPEPERSSSSPEGLEETTERGGGQIRKVVEENPVVVVGRRGCCMVHVVRRLLQGQGVNPVVCEVGDDADESALLAGLSGASAPEVMPAVFVGGRLVGGLDRLMAVHIAGELVPILKQAGALWL